MLPRDSLKDLLANETLSRTDKILVCLGVDPPVPKTVAQIVELAVASGLRPAKNWNVSSLLSRSRGMAMRTAEGWELSCAGRAHVDSLSAAFAQSPAPRAATSLRALLSRISDAQTSAFVEEAVRCLEAKAYRAATVLAWVGAVSLLFEHILLRQLPAFNAEASRRDPKWKPARTGDDLARMRESDFLDVLEAISVLGKNVKNELKKCLDLRNACGHPSSLQIGESSVAAHIELLILNVFSRFAV